MGKTIREKVRISWKKPTLTKLTQEKRNQAYDLLHAQAMYDALGDTEGFMGILIIHGPQLPGEIETCAAYCRQPCTLSDAHETHCGHH